MSEEQRRHDETDVESHVHRHAENDEPTDEGDTEVEAHVQHVPNVRMDSPSNS
jgi:hypothetical protein